MEQIKVTQDLSTQDEYSVSHLIGLIFQGEWDAKGKGYLVTYQGHCYFVKQDEVECVEEVA